MAQNINSLIEELQGKIANIEQKKLNLNGNKLAIQQSLNQAKANKAKIESNEASVKATSLPTWYYAAGAVVFIVIALLAYFFVFRKSSTTSSSSSPTAVAAKPDTKSPAAKTGNSPAAKTDTPVEEQVDSSMFPDTTLPQDYQIFKSVADPKKALGLSDKKDKVAYKDYTNAISSDAIGIIDGKLRINDMCIRKDKDDDFKLIKCTDVLGSVATYDETTKLLKNGTRCLYYDKSLKMNTNCKASDKKYQWTKDLLPKA